MTAAVGKVAKSAAGKSAASSTASKAAASPSAGGVAGTPKTKAKTSKAKAPTDNTKNLSGEKAQPDTESGGLKIGPPVPAAPQVPAVVNTGAGFILGLFFWTMIALPFLNNGGVTGVKNQLRAKFFNKAPDGSWLP